ncbi:hypothetical protein [Neisseria animalis]|uniref:MORN repeat protein n=1 Tax=Neisseria animalis TaxID=492 RepID=A0A5P3MNQ4_NEIAN|nr:hypothetical protein [Neisseria animalis]QEY23108.1 hypothetical protein D0T90_00125 [Neisseria animalis]ROW32440.1 hypothetical protein CGZ60_04825 [Neisseria animalis]
MLKYIALLGLGLGLSVPVAAAVINDYQGQGCRYEGAVKDSKPEGKGVWSCQDGRSYSGQFKQGRFHGKGIYSVRVTKPVFLDSFNVNSTKLRGMDLEGTFRNGSADGRFKVLQNGTVLFLMTFDKGMMQAVDLPKAVKK